MEIQKPSVGRIVHMVGHKGECLAAIISDVVDNDTVYLTVFPSVQSPYPMMSSIPYSLGPEIITSDIHKNTWHWPEKI